jgi:hypothetical protein
MPSNFELLEQILETRGPDQLLDELCNTLRETKDYHGLFYALVLKERVRLGLSAVQPARAEDVPKELQEPYENAIRVAARTVGQLFLDEGDIAGAWPFYRMIGEPGPIATAIDAARISEDEGEKLQQVIQIALHEGANPLKGFELVIQRYGICNAITMFGQGAVQTPEARTQCLKLLVRSLYSELRERLAADLEGRGEITPPTPPSQGGEQREAQRLQSPGLATVRDMVKLLNPFTEEEFYHIDVSHLSTVVQFSIDLPVCEEMNLAAELCEYGMKLSPKFRGAGEPPFEDMYRDYHFYFEVLLGKDVEEGIAHFRSKAEAADPQETTLPGEVLVNLLVRLERYPEAVRAFTRYLGQADARQLGCPSLQELCHRIGDYKPLVEVSVRRGDLVNYAAGLLQERQKK